MKNKTQNDPFKTHCWAFTVVTDPYQVFAECFVFTDIGSYRKTIRQVLLSAARNKVHKKESPASVLDLFKAIHSVMLAARALYRQNKTSELQLKPEQFMDKRLYTRPGAAFAEWEYLPKTLSKKEYQNPYLVFHRFFKYQNTEAWQQSMEQVLSNAFSGYASDHTLHLLNLYLHLTRLMEAAHLIDVREVLHVDGDLKPGPTC
ncbi:hypothetical protein [Niabella hirudinis]|uniref:hypothetical protein n=1 Tax=Niabella hirudinis TaxID=1285929 RepID=UPI003EC021AA